MSNWGGAKKGFSVFILVALILSVAGCSEEAAPSFSIGTGSMQGRYVVIGATISRLVNRNEVNDVFRLDFETTSGSVANIDAIASGDLQFGIAQSDHQFQAVNGLGEWEGKGPQKELRSVFGMYTETITLVVGADSEIRSISDLAGKSVDIGPPGSGTRQNAIDALAAAGIDWRVDLQVSEQNPEEMLSRFMRGELDAFFFTAGHPNSNVKYASYSVRGARMIPLENIDDLVSARPWFVRARIPSELYPMAENDLDIETVGVNATLITSANVPDDVVYIVTKSTLENLESLAMQDAGFDFTALIDNAFLDGLTAPIHPGALKYYREIGLTIPEP